jgi:hypothetical protein
LIFKMKIRIAMKIDRTAKMSVVIRFPNNLKKVAPIIIASIIPSD